MDGEYPYDALIQAADGSLYGTTIYGGSGSYCGGDCAGTIFKISSHGVLTTLYSFCNQPNCADGGLPYANLIQTTDANFYGTTIYGGKFNACGGGSSCGTVFQINDQGELTTVHSFANTDGAAPYGGLLQATSGILYGTTALGGNLACNAPNGCGTVFSLDMGLGPFVAFVRGSGKVGQTGGILGQDFTGTSSVALNGVPATFKVVSDTYITATVPLGATSGYVTVTTPSGTLTSNKPFIVVP